MNAKYFNLLRNRLPQGPAWLSKFRGSGGTPLSVRERLDANIVEAADTLSGAAALLIQGSAGIAEAADTLSGAAALLIQGSAGIAEAADTLSGAAVLGISGSASIAEAGDALSSASVALVAASLVATEQADAIAATAVALIAGASTIVEGGDATSSTGSLLVTGNEAGVEDPDAIAADGTVSNSGISGDLAQVEAPDGVVAAAAIAITATAALSEYGDASTLPIEESGGAGFIFIGRRPKAKAAAATALVPLVAPQLVAITAAAVLAEQDDALSADSSIAGRGHERRRHEEEWLLRLAA